MTECVSKVTQVPEDETEVLPVKVPVGVSLVHSPNIETHLEQYRSNIMEVLEISDDDWPDGKEVEVVVEMALMPSRIRTKVRNVAHQIPEEQLPPCKWG